MLPHPRSFAIVVPLGDRPVKDVDLSLNCQIKGGLFFMVKSHDSNDQTGKRNHHHDRFENCQKASPPFNTGLADHP